MKRLLSLITILLLVSFAPSLAARDFFDDTQGRGVYGLFNLTYVNASTICVGDPLWCFDEGSDINNSGNVSSGDDYIDISYSGYIAEITLDETKLNTTIDARPTLGSQLENLFSTTIGLLYRSASNTYQSIALGTNFAISGGILNILDGSIKADKLNTTDITLADFTDDLGDRGYTVLSNFTDDLGDRGYTHLSNFTNDAGFRSLNQNLNTTDSPTFTNMTADYFIGDGSRLTGIEQGELLLYFNADGSDDVVGNYTLSSLYNSTEVTLSAAGLADGGTLMGSWITDQGVPNINLLEGNMRVHVAGLKSSSNKNVQFYFKVYSTNSSGGNRNLISTSEYSSSLTTVRTNYDIWAYAEEYIMNSTNRLLIEGYAFVSGSGVAPTATAYIQGNSKTRLVVPVGAVSVEKFVPYTGAIRDVDLGTHDLTASNLSGALTWTDLHSYPAACSAGQYVSTIGDTLTCGTPVDTNTLYTAGTGLTLIGTIFNADMTYLNATMDARDSDTTYSHLSNFTNDEGFIANGTSGSLTNLGITGFINITRSGTSTPSINFYSSTGVLRNRIYLQGDDFSPIQVDQTLNVGQNLQVTGLILAGSDIYTTGAGDDFWLGTSTQASALFQANATGHMRAQTGYFADVHSLDWTNVSITTSQISDYTSFSGTVNRSQVINNWVACPAGSAVYHENETGRYCDATFVNTTDIAGFRSLNQNLNTTSAVTFATVDTGQGANELYDMDQNVLTTSSVKFAGLNVSGDNIYIGDGEANQYIYFYDGGSHTGKSLRWDDASNYFAFTSPVVSSQFWATSILRSDGDIYTTGAGDDLWLGTSTQASALFQANATGNIKFKNATSVECITFASGAKIGDCD